MDITKKYNISGPVNIMRLTNNKKIVYIFGDLHNQLIDQSECIYNRDIETIEIDKFFRKIFKNNPNKKFDFFYEGYYNISPKIDTIQKDNFLYNNNYYTSKYFVQILKFVFNNIDIVDNKIHTSKQFNNVRLHYFNFRSVIPNLIFILQNTNDFLNMRQSYNYDNILNNLTNYIRLLTDIKKFLKSDSNSYIKKIKSVYKNIDIQKIIQKIYNTYVINLLDDVFKLINETLDYIKKTPKLFDKYTTLIDLYELNKIIYINIDKISLYIMNLFCNVIDIYLIRRLLDKDYINNCIIYTGVYHMIDIAYLLIKYFDFKITHVANSDKTIDNNNIEELNKIIKTKNIANYNDGVFLSTYLENNRYQCSNLFNFPDNLE